MSMMALALGEGWSVRSDALYYVQVVEGQRCNVGGELDDGAEIERVYVVREGFAHVPFDETVEVPPECALEGVALLAVEFGDVVCVRHKALVSPCLEQGQHNALCERGRLKV